MRKTNGEYAQAVKACRELREKIDPLIESKKELALEECGFSDFREYLENEFTVSAVEQQAFYKQGYLDCVVILQGLGVLR